MYYLRTFQSSAQWSNMDARCRVFQTVWCTCIASQIRSKGLEDAPIKQLWASSWKNCYQHKPQFRSSTSSCSWCFTFGLGIGWRSMLHSILPSINFADNTCNCVILDCYTSRSSYWVATQRNRKANRVQNIYPGSPILWSLGLCFHDGQWTMLCSCCWKVTQHWHPTESKIHSRYDF